MKENISKRTARSKTFDLGNGKHMLRLGRSPLHYRDETGHLQDIDLEPVNVGQFLGIEKAPYRLVVDPKAPAHRYTSLSGKETSIELVEAGGKAIGKKIATTGNRTFRYRNIAKDTDYIITPLYHGVRTDLVISSDKAPRTFKWKIMGEAGLIQPLVGQDAKGRRLEIETVYGDGEITATWTGRAQDWKMARRNEWTEAVVYPVRIDPTINEEITAGADDGVWSYSTTITPSGVLTQSYTNLVTQTIPAGRAFQQESSTTTNGLKTAAFRFQSIAIPQGSTIDSAILTLNVVSVAGSPTLRIFGNDVDDAGAWNVTTNRIANVTKTSAFAAMSPTATGTGYTVDIKDVVQEWVNRAGMSSGNNFALVVENIGAFGTGVSTYTQNTARFEAFEAPGTNHATLDITYTAAAGANLPHAKMHMSIGIGL